MKRAALVLAFTLVAASAHADESAREADRAFEEGKVLMDRGSFAAACSRFEASLALQPGIGTRLWLADCYENLGRTATAQRQFRIAAAEAHKSGDRREQIAQKRVDLLESRVVKIVVNVERPAEGESVQVDGVIVTPGTDAAPVAVDPGRHLVGATAPGRKSWELSFDAVASDRPVPVVVPELALTDPLVKPPPPIAPPPQPPPQPPPETTASSPWRTVGIGAGTVGAAGIAASGVLGLLAINDHTTSDRGCQATCTPDAHDTGERAFHEANAATVTFIVGGALLAGGIALYLFSPNVSTRIARSPHGAALTF